MACGHCGFLGDLETKVSEVIDREDMLGGGGKPIGEWTKIVQVQRCPVCSELILSQYDWNDWMEPDEAVVEVIYPQPRNASPLPAAVAKEYGKAQRVRTIDNEYFALGIRRTLEVICADRGFPQKTKGDSLKSRLKCLAAAGRLPQAPWNFGDDGPGVIVTQ